MSDLLPTVAAALNTPEALVRRSAAARAAANGTTIDDVLAAWAGGAPVVAATPAAAPEPDAASTQGEAPPAPELVATSEAAVTAAPVTLVVETEPEPEIPVEPVPLSKRIRSATRVGAWTGSVLGLTGFLVATTWWAQNATVIGEGPFTPVIQTTSRTVIIGAALVSILFGAITAGLSRASAAWASPGMQLRNSAPSTGWLGALIGLVLGVGAAALLTGGFGTPVEGAEGMVQLPVLPTLAVMLIGGAALGAITAAITQTVAVPVAVDADEVADVRSRLGGALTIPLIALILLVVLVLPFAWGLIQSAHVTKEAAALVAIITSIGILGFASLAGTRPNVKISFGEAMIALLGIVTILIIVFAVLFARSPAEEPEEAGQEATAVSILA